MENCVITFNHKTGIFTATFTFNNKKYTITDISEAKLNNKLQDFTADYVLANNTDTTPSCK